MSDLADVVQKNVSIDVSRLPGPIPLAMRVDEFDEDFLVVENVHPYGRQITHPFVLVRKDVLRDEQQHVRTMKGLDAIRACEEQMLVLPPASVLCPLLVALHAARDRSYVTPTLMQFKSNRSWFGEHAVNTIIRLAGRRGEIIDYPRKKDFPVDGSPRRGRVNAGLRQVSSFSLEDVQDNLSLDDSLYRILRGRHQQLIAYAQLFSGLEDPGLLIPVGKYFKRSVSVTPHVVREEDKVITSVSVGCNSYYFGLYSFDNPFYTCVVRGIRF